MTDSVKYRIKNKMTTTLRKKHAVKLKKKLNSYHSYIDRHIFRYGTRFNIDTIVDILSIPMNRIIIFKCTQALFYAEGIKPRLTRLSDHRTHVYRNRQKSSTYYHEPEEYETKEMIEESFHYMNDRFMSIYRLSYLNDIPHYAWKNGFVAKKPKN